MSTIRYFAGLDLGQAADYTALAIVAREELVGEYDYVMRAHKKIVQTELVYLERMKLGTPYPEVVERMREILEQAPLAGRVDLVFDGTGVGRGVRDFIAGAGFACPVWPVSITAGDRESQSDGYHRVPKKDLVGGLQLEMQLRRLRIGSTLQWASVLMKEMSEIRARVSPAGNEQFGAWRSGSHDDMVLAVALCCWLMRRIYPNSAQGYFDVPARLLPVEFVRR